nr:hypothetical protein [Thioflavicoccus mobilis]
MARDDVVDILCLAASRNPDQAKDAGVRMLEYDRQLPEVFALGDQDAPFSVNDAQDLLVSGILNPRTSPDDVMSPLGEPNNRAARDADIE